MTAVLEQRQVMAVDAAVGGLLAADWSRVTSADLLRELEGLTRIGNRLDAVRTALLAEVESRRVDGDYGGTRTTSELFAAVCPATGRAAADRVDLAVALMPRRSLLGEQLPAAAPITAAACVGGQVSVEQATVIVTTVEQARRIPAAVRDPRLVEIAERTLVEACAYEHVPGLKRMAARLLTEIDAEGSEPADEPAWPAPPEPTIHYSRRRNGLNRIVADLDDEQFALARAAMDSLSAPQPGPGATDRPGDHTGGDADRGTDACPDERSAPQRRADAFVEIVRRVMRSGTLPWSGGASTTVLVRCDLADLIARRGTAVTGYGESIPIPDLIAACGGDTAFLPVVTGQDGEVLHLGREQRLASPPQKRALASRDSGCCFPGCDRPPSWTEAHHVREWVRDGGGTDVDNLILLCPFHHRRFEAAGWQVRMARGVPEWIPPSWIDPLRRPRRNTRRRNETVFRRTVGLLRT